MAREVKLTKAGYERLMQQLERERERLQEATKILQELMESSDDYDDSGLEAAKQEKARIEARIDSLEDILSRAVILEEGSGEVIGLGSVVELEDPLSGERLSVQVVSPAEANVLDTPMKISDASPMGKALLGHRVGDVLFCGDTLFAGSCGRTDFVGGSSGQILQSLNLKPRKLDIVSCPSCGRAQVDVSTLPAKATEGLKHLEVPLRVAVMGCVVNGPGEAREADLGVASGNGKGQIFVKGEVIKTVPEEDIVETLLAEARRIADEMGEVGSPQVSVS